MRLSEWRAAAPMRESMTLKVLAVVEPVLEAMGAERDPYCWVAWGDDPSIRYSVLVPVPAGLINCSVRVNIPGEGPRASAKLARWNRVQLGELAVETQAGHRLVTFQVDQYVLRGADAIADRVARFALVLFAAVDGRPVPDVVARAARRTAATKASVGTTKPTAGPTAGTNKPTAAANKPTAANKPAAPGRPRAASAAARTSTAGAEDAVPKSA